MSNGAALSLRFERLGSGDREAARALFEVMATAFEEDGECLNDAYVDGLVARRDLWVVVAWHEAAVVGGLTAHVLPMTRSASTELFIYDLAVHPAYQRRGVGRGLISFLRERARAEGHGVIFVPADDEDTHALEFYRAVGGVGADLHVRRVTGPPRRRPRWTRCFARWSSRRTLGRSRVIWPDWTKAKELQ